MAQTGHMMWSGNYRFNFWLCTFFLHQRSPCRPDLNTSNHRLLLICCHKIENEHTMLHTDTLLCWLSPMLICHVILNLNFLYFVTVAEFTVDSFKPVSKMVWKKWCMLFLVRSISNLIPMWNHFLSQLQLSRSDFKI